MDWLYWKYMELNHNPQGKILSLVFQMNFINLQLPIAHYPLMQCTWGGRLSNDLVTTLPDSRSYWVTRLLWGFSMWLCRSGPRLLCKKLGFSFSGWHSEMLENSRAAVLVLSEIQDRCPSTLDNREWNTGNERKGFPEASTLRRKYWGYLPGTLRSNMAIRLWKGGTHQP